MLKTEGVKEQIDVNAVNRKFAFPLHYAAGEGKLEVVETFVCSGADVKSEDFEGRTHIDYANDENYSDIVSILSQEIMVQKQANSSEDNFFVALANLIYLI